MFTAFPPAEIDAVMRRTLRTCVVLAVVACVAAIEFGHALIAPGVVIGFALALGNHRLFQASAMRFIGPEGTVHRKPFAGATLGRLGAATAVALLLLVFVRPMGWGVIAGLALFQAALLANAIVSLLAYQRRQVGGTDV